MLSQFYRYLQRKLSDYFLESFILPGSRFFVELDNQEQASLFYNSFLDTLTSAVFNIDGSNVELMTAQFSSNNIIVASTSTGMSNDFLVTLRNRVSLQEDEWEGYSVLFIISERLDSIVMGSQNLKDSGYPLNFHEIENQLSYEIRNSSLDDSEKIVLEFVLGEISTDLYTKISLDEYSVVLGTIQQGSISDSDYINFQLFKDESLPTYSEDSNKFKRLKSNKDSFAEISFAKEIEDSSILISKYGDSIDDLLSQGLTNIDYSDIYQLLETEKLKHRNLTISSYHFTESSNDDSVVELSANRVDNSTISVICYSISSNGWFVVEFDDEIHSDSVNIERLKSLEYTFVGNRFRVKLSSERLFYFIDFNDSYYKKSRVKINLLFVRVKNEIFDSVMKYITIDAKRKKVCISGVSELAIGNNAKEPSYYDLVLNENMLFLDQEKNYLIQLNNNFESEVNVAFLIQLDYCSISVEASTDSIVEKTIDSINLIRNVINSSRQSFSYNNENGTISSADRSFLIKGKHIEQFISYEYDIVTKKFESSYFSSKNMLPTLKNAYEELFNYFNKLNTCPSLAFIDNTLRELLTEITTISKINIENIEMNSILGEDSKSLFKIGTFKIDDDVLLSPFHPLIISFMLEVDNQISLFSIKDEIFDRINAAQLMPFIYDKHRVLIAKSVPQIFNWVIYQMINSQSRSEDGYTSSIVFEKLNQFSEHYSFLFLSPGKSKLIINLININDDFNVMIGILRFILFEIESKGDFNKVTPININIYKSRELSTSIELLSNLRSLNELGLNQTLSKNSKILKTIDERDLINLIQEKVKYSRISDTCDEYTNSHISFVSLMRDPRYTMNQNSDFESGLQLGGILSTTSTKFNGDFRIGFGVNFSPETDLNVVSTLYNELAANMQDDGQNSYSKGRVISSKISLDQLSALNKAYKNSNWVTLLSPDLNLDYLIQSTPDLLIIHYSDQLTSFKKFDSITVTNKTHLYKTVLSDYLRNHHINPSDEQITKTIRSFNAINGEWLLRILTKDSRGGYFGKEKLSLISAVKYVLSFLYHPKILWIPVSTEEVVRIAGLANINTLKSVFSAKNLKYSGSLSDDLLFIGLSREESSLKVYFYPVEVKIGNVPSAAIQHAGEQLKNMVQLIDNNIIKNSNLFEKKFYLNFFVQLALSNSQLLSVYEFWEQEYSPDSLTAAMKKRINKGLFETGVLGQYIGSSAVISFKKEESHRQINLSDNIINIKLVDTDGEKGIYEDMVEIFSRFSNIGFITNSHLSLRNVSFPLEAENDNIIVSSLENKAKVAEIENLDMSEQINCIKNETEEIIETNIHETTKAEVNTIDVELMNETQKEDSPMPSQNTVLSELSKVRVLIGVEHSRNKEIYWEFGHPNLPNRHMLISGSSGQGKTYLIECLLFELAQQGISSVIFDYTQGFTEEKIENELKVNLVGKISQVEVLKEKLSINPFTLQKLDEDTFESPVIVAQRIADIFAHVYTLGEQQYSALYQACKSGLDKYGSSMSISLIDEELNLLDSSYSKSVQSKLKPFFDLDFFKLDEAINWGQWLYSGGEMKVIQMRNIPKQMQITLTEIILWDIWYFVQKQGNESKPFVAVLDESQNLSFTDNSPSAKILTEGRKFGWSAIFATQFLEGQLKKEEIMRLQNADQKIYFRPPEKEIPSMAKMIEPGLLKGRMESQLRNLEKGKCIVVGSGYDYKKLANRNPALVSVANLASRLKGKDK